MTARLVPRPFLGSLSLSKRIAGVGAYRRPNGSRSITIVTICWCSADPGRSTSWLSETAAQLIRSDGLEYESPEKRPGCAASTYPGPPADDVAQAAEAMSGLASDPSLCCTARVGVQAGRISAASSRESGGSERYRRHATMRVRNRDGVEHTVSSGSTDRSRAIACGWLESSGIAEDDEKKTWIDRRRFREDFGARSEAITIDAGSSSHATQPAYFPRRVAGSEHRWRGEARVTSCFS